MGLRLYETIEHLTQRKTNCIQTAMKLLLIAVILSVLVFTEARPDELEYQLLDNFSSCMKAAFAQQPQRMMKRNSELLNSLLGLPQNILRSGK